MGDLYALGGPYFGGRHIRSITLTCPIFYQGMLIICSVIRAHHSNVSGPIRGGCTPPLANYTRKACASHP
ncbi:MAG: hydantoinase B/oxoprolinase family protein [Chloroflexi bacterium]|nr:hydantoinase B/oxoprolinase family protein [Chloroflexota bacterium]